jgi:hypothetical protein
MSFSSGLARGYDGESVTGIVGGTILLLLVAPILNTLFAGVGAWLISLVFEGSIRAVWRGIGINLDQFSFFQIGCALGFVGGFLRSSVTTSKS